jgi:hypothetical protein
MGYDDMITRQGAAPLQPPQGAPDHVWRSRGRVRQRGEDKRHRDEEERMRQSMRGSSHKSC